MERGASLMVSLKTTKDTTSSHVDPFLDGLKSPSASSIALSSAREISNIPPAKYFHSRRIRKDESYALPIFKKHPGEKWLWIIPAIGLVGGLAVSGLVVYYGISGGSYNYCPVLNEDFSSGVLNPRIWTKEVEVGGFG